MSEATDEPTSARGLDDILREAGISAAGGGGRRRRRDEARTAQDADSGTTEPSDRARDEPAQTAYRYEDVPAGTDVGGLSAYFLARSEVASPEPTAPPREREPPAVTTPARKPPERTPPDHKPPDLKPPDRKPPDHKPAEIAPALLLPPRTDTGPVPTAGWSSPGTGWPASSASPAKATVATNSTAITSTTAKVRSTATGSTQANGPVEAPSTSTTSHANRSASPVATTPAADEDEIASAVPVRGGVASWAILAVELLAALGLGVAAWYAFSAVWELLPYVAAFAGPLVVTGLVAVAGALRSRTGRNPLGLPTLCILVFAGTVLVVLPAATVIIP